MQRNGRLEHRLRQRTRHARGSGGGGEGGVLRLFHPQHGARVRHGALGQFQRFAGRAPAVVHRARHARRPAHAHSGRGDQQHRYDDRAAHPEGVPQDHEGQDVLHRRAQAFDHSGRRSYPCHEGRRRHRTGHARAADGAARVLLRSVQRAVCEVAQKINKVNYG